MSRGRALPVACLFAAAVLASAAFATWQQGRGENVWGNAGWQQVQNAIAVAEGRGFGRSYPFGFHPGLFLRPVYTLVLTPFVAALRWDSDAFRIAVAAVQGAMNAGTGLAAGWILARAGAPRAATVARWACALSPFLVSQAATIVDTTVFTLLLAGTWALLVRAASRPTAGAWALAGLSLGLAVLTRSTALALVPVAFFRLLETRPAPREWAVRGGACACAAFLVLVPWFLRNHALTDRWMLSTVDAVNVWMGNNENTGRFLDESRSLDDLPGRAPYDALAMVRVEEQLAAYDAAREATSRWVRENPGEALVLAVRKAALLWSPTVRPRTTRSGLHDVKDLVAAGWSLLVYGSALAGVVAVGRSPALRPVLRDVTLTALVFTVPHAIAWSGTRLRTPLEPFLLAVAALGAAAVLDRLRPKAA